MKVLHYPIFNIQKIIKHFKESDATPIKYVCTTSKSGDGVMDIYCRANNVPHPTFGNVYFGLFYDQFKQSMMICNADWVQDLTFALVENDYGELEYSQRQHDYKKFKNGNTIDGGRDYVRHNGCKIYVYKVKDGEFILNEEGE